MSRVLLPEDRDRLCRLLKALVDQSAASVLVPPYEAASGFWFGGGNVVSDAEGTLWLVGRYRNFGDSRTGLRVGERGLECALFSSRDGGRTFRKERSWSKADLSYAGNRVVSIEGTSLFRREDGTWELYISSEKDLPYPAPVADYRKPGTGVWTIDVIRGESPASLDAASIRCALGPGADPGYLHVKDPVVCAGPSGETRMIFCSHPFCWSCSNTGLAVRDAGSEVFRPVTNELVGRGPTWDVAGTRVTARLAVPRVGGLSRLPQVSVYFYDGLECLRNMDENEKAVTRPRGYSCEELGGAFAGFDDEFPRMDRLSPLFPLFVSPFGTGCSRYVETVVTPEGILATWQQSRADRSQPLVGHFLDMERVTSLLA